MSAAHEHASAGGRAGRRADGARRGCVGVGRLRRMKRNCTDAEQMLGSLREDLGALDRDLRRALADLDRTLAGKGGRPAGASAS